MKIFLVYDKLNKGKQKGNANTNYECVFLKSLHLHNIDVKLVPIDRLQSFIKFDGLFLYPIEPTKATLGKNIESIPNDSVDVLRKFKIPILLIEFDTVSYPSVNLMNYIRNYNDLEFYIISTNLRISIAPCNKIRKIYNINYWESTSRVFAKIVAEDTPLVDSKITPESKNKDFLCVNRNIRSHRLALVSEFIRNNLFDNSYYSLIGSDSTLLKINTIDEARSLVDTDGIEYLLKFSKDLKPIYLDSADRSVTYPFKTTFISLFHETFFSIITETEISQDVFFISEKTFRPIAYCHPFMVFGSPGTMNWLRSQGYETFPELFDESYDEEPAGQKRLSMIISQVKKFKTLSLSQKRKIFKNLIPKLIFNRDLFWKRPNIFKTEMEEIFLDIYKNWRCVPGSNR